MKELIKKWLEIEGFLTESYAKDYIDDQIKYIKENNKKMVKEAIIEAFSKEADAYDKMIKGVYFGDYDISGSLDKSILRVIQLNYNGNLKDTIKSNINSEKFIDEIVERINKKQIGR